VLLPWTWRHRCNDVNEEARRHGVKEEVSVSKTRRCRQSDTNEEAPVSLPVSFYYADKEVLVSQARMSWHCAADEETPGSGQHHDIDKEISMLGSRGGLHWDTGKEVQMPKKK